MLFYCAVAAKLIDATVLNPRRPDHAAIAALHPDMKMRLPTPQRAPIVGQDGQLLAVSLRGAALYANPRQVRDPDGIARRLERVLPALDIRLVEERLKARGKSFVYLDRHLTATQELAINRLGIPGLYLLPVWIRHYPDGRIAAHILGGVTPAGRGIAGVEAFFNRRLIRDPNQPLHLSIDVGVQAVVQDTLRKAVKEWKAAGACGIVESMTGRIVAMASLPEYNANDMHGASPNALFDRCISGDYEPGSVMKLMTMPMALQSGMIHYWDRFNTTHPLFVDGFSVRDYEPVHHWLALPAILAFSSNIGASRIATMLGPTIQRAWLRKMGFFRRSPIQLPSAQPPLWHPKDRWHLLTTMTTSFGNGIAMAPIILVNAVVADVNGGVLFKPTLLARRPGSPPRRGIRVMRRTVSATMRRLMRDVVLAGTGVYAKVPGYLVGGKTGTSQVVGPQGTYLHHLNDSSFMAVFPSNRPRYVVYVMVMKPRPTKAMRRFSFGFTTGGYVAAPAVAHIIRRIGPMMGILPITGHALAIADKRFRIPLKPTPPKGRLALGPHHPFPLGANAYAYVLAGLKPPNHVDRAAQRAALRRVKMAIPNQTIHGLPRRGNARLRVSRATATAAPQGIARG